MENLTAQELEMMFNDIWQAREKEKNETGEINEVREDILRKIHTAAQKEVNK